MCVCVCVFVFLLLFFVVVVFLCVCFFFCLFFFFFVFAKVLTGPYFHISLTFIYCKDPDQTERMRIILSYQTPPIPMHSTLDNY